MPRHTSPKPERQEPHLDHPVLTFFRFLRYLLPYWDKMVLTLVVTVIFSPMGQVGMFLHKKVVDEALTNLLDPPDVRWRRALLFFAIGASLTWFGRYIGIISGFMGWYMNWRVTLDLRTLFYNHLHRLPVSFFRGRPIGEHMFRCMADIASDGHKRGVVDMVTDVVPLFFDVLNKFFWTGALVFYLNPKVLYMVVIVIIPYTFLTHYMTTWLKRAFYLQRMEEQLVPAVLRDSIAGVETLKSYGRTRYMTRRYVRQLIRAVRAKMKTELLFILTGPSVGAQWLPYLIPFASLWTYLTYQLMIHEITVGEFSVLFAVSVNSLPPFTQLVNNWQIIRQQLVPAQRILETLDVEPAIQDLPDAVPMRRVDGQIRFEHVSFGYSPDIPVLKDVSFSIEPGKTLGIVGRSGAGKSTILNLILRLYRPDSGRIFIDDYDLDKIRIADWQAQTGVVMQHTFLFGGDVAENVRYGKPKASEAEVWEALRMADSDEFVRRLPDGLHTDLSEGTKLSGGQKQRLGIARAMVRKPRVLVLDEPTSALDSRTENEIWKSFEKVMADSTAVVISHRLATVRKADKIIVLKDGRIVETGSHDDLLAIKGVYYSMWAEQTGLV